MKNLISAAIELNKVLGLNPKITVAGKVAKADLEAALITAGDLLEPEDKITKETAETLLSLGVKVPGFTKKAPTAPARGKKEETPADTNEGGSDDDGETDEKTEKEEAKAKAKKDKKVKAGKTEGPGIIATIALTIEGAGKKGVTKDEILKVLVTNFPDKVETSMKNTINVQVPNRISKEKFLVAKTEDGHYYKVEAKK